MTRNTPLFPPSAGPRTWLITAAASPIGLRLARSLLEHGDNVVLGGSVSDLSCLPPAFLSGASKASSDPQSETDPTLEYSEHGDRAEVFAHFVTTEIVRNGWSERSKVVGVDSRFGQCQTAVAEAITTFGKIDVLFCCASEAIVGTVEETGASWRSKMLVREQFETNLFGPINIIKATLPAMRERKSGHIITLTGITSHLGTPGIGLFCASGWAIEGFCDSLAYEIAPFNIKLTIVQPNYEIPVLSNKISAAPTMSQYLPTNHPAPLARGMIGSLIDRIEGLKPPTVAATEDATASRGRRSSGTSETSDSMDERETKKRPNISLSESEDVTTVYPKLPQKMLDSLVAETVYAVASIGGHENPPARHIVGNEGVASVKEKLKTVSEELEDFVECSSAVDIDTGRTPEAK